MPQSGRSCATSPGESRAEACRSTGRASQNLRPKGASDVSIDGAIDLADGLAETAACYRDKGWLKPCAR